MIDSGIQMRSSRSEPSAWNEPGSDEAHSADWLSLSYETHQKQIRGFAWSVSRDPVVADDLCAEAFTRLCDVAGAGRAPADPRAWLFRVVANLAISRARRNEVARRRGDAIGPPDHSLGDSPEAVVLEREANDAVRSALAGLPFDQRTALLLAADGFSGPEIGRLLRRSPGGTRTMMCRARARVRSILESQAVS